MTRALVTLTLLTGAATLTGCGTACGPMRTVPAQRLSLVAPVPTRYTIRVIPDVGTPIETPVPADGRVTFEVPVTSRDSAFFCLGLPVYHYPAPDTRHVIRLIRDDRTVRKLSAQDIGRLPTDADGNHLLRTE